MTSARQSTLRATNLGLVARTVCAAALPPSRADVAAATSMTRATASRLVDELVAGGVLAETEPAAAGRGRPATPLVPGARFAALGLQVNAGFLAVRVLDLRGHVVGEALEQDDFVGSDPASTLARLGRLCREVLDGLPREVTLTGAGLALPGLVATETGLLLRAPNLGWSDVRPEPLLRGAVPEGLGLHVDNEASLAAHTVAETAPGRPGAFPDFIYLSGEIGIGGAAVLGGRVMAGRHGWAGEIGHVTVDPAGPECRCGSTGCLETYAGRDALLAVAGLAHPAELAARAAAGDERALAAVATGARALGVALAGVVNVLDIPTVVLGGHLAHLADLLRDDLEEQLRTRVLSARWTPPKIEAAQAIPAPGATGAAFRELAGLLADPARWLG
ncbi:putative NBD/HSP70 family sugar kinase [Amycolatopsis bartoniae]|uniref:Sugar kinase n=1 Tax=Amycolatopsis bartoniae TaxID=941986 RepID=A0A8H9J0G7_9PSEU|nr:ROK family protein [Amycolatopsis bartoniae]MBB2936449.1 putative NBD/HSP70 family sugar kinase [Amycolatopsis bartoniae]TVT11064.1 ROK family protein [Amycolatopsis bartoniae]GHF68863.1 sugar kinase [Amycolatopsis bartoniae]